MERHRRRSHDAVSNISSSLPTSRRTPREMTSSSSSPPPPPPRKLEVGIGRSRHHRNSTNPPATMNRSDQPHHIHKPSSSSSYEHHHRHSSSSDNITTGAGGKSYDRASSSRSSGGAIRERDRDNSSNSKRVLTSNAPSANPKYASSSSKHTSSSSRDDTIVMRRSSSSTNKSQLPLLRMVSNTTRRSSDIISSPPSRTTSSSSSRRLGMRSESSLSSKKFLSRSCPTFEDIPATPDENVAARRGKKVGHDNKRMVSPVDIVKSVTSTNHDTTTTTDSKSKTTMTQHHLKKDGSSTLKCSSTRKVSNMAYTDPFGDAGLYTGEVDMETQRPHGKGKMKYDNGIYFEGTWYYGCKNDSMGLKNNGISTMGGASITTSCVTQDGSTRERILSGFTSWKGKRSTTDSSSSNGSSSFVYGMDWVDASGLSGKYTGRVNESDVPDGKGVMRYHFGLIAEGDWIKGVLNTGAGAGVNPIMAAAGNPTGAMSGAMSIAPGMSVYGVGGGGGGAMSVVSGLGMTSICGGGMGGLYYPPTPSVAAAGGVYNSMVNLNPYYANNNNVMAWMPRAPNTTG